MAQTAVPPAAGDGTQANPYHIATLENLYWIASNSDNSSYFFVQTADINASETSNWFGGQGWTPIGIGFGGHYNGEGHIIDSLFIDRRGRNVGLFSTNYGSIDSLGVTHVEIVDSDMVVGALVGMNNGAVGYCFSDGSVTGTSSQAGGLVGENSMGYIYNCYSAANVSGSSAVGGLVGENLGYAIFNCYSIGNASGNNDVGGLVGAVFNASVSSLTFCYSAGRVSGTGSVGGLVGGIDSVSASASYPISIYNSYWDTDASGLSTSSGGEGITTIEMKTPSFFAEVGWNASIWHADVNINNGYPYLSWQDPGGTPLPAGIAVAPSMGNGSAENPYRIATLGNLYWLASDPTLWGSYFLQVADIDASSTNGFGNGEGWSPIGISALYFEGSYNGGGHIIHSLFISRPKSDCQGLFGNVEFGAVIDSLGVVNSNIAGDDDVGGLVGSAAWNSSIRNCFSTGNVTGKGDYVGGLVGWFSDGSTMSNCYSKASVKGENTVGGLVGINQTLGKVDHSYSTGLVAGSGNVGGLVGENVTDRGAAVSSSFWDTETSGQAASSGGTGETTIQMNTAATFSEAGWSDTLWCMEAAFNDGYPYLSWQNPNGAPLPRMPGFVVSADSIDFGTVFTDSTKEDSDLVSNPGTDTLRVTGIESTNKGFSFAPAKLNVAPSGSAYLKVMFTAGDTTEQTGYLVLTYNSTRSPDTIAVRGKGAVLTAVGRHTGIPTSFGISQNYPNPFNPTTVISYQLPVASVVTLRVYDVLGREIATLVNGRRTAGIHSVTFDAGVFPSGVYFYSITAGTFHQSRKMILIK